MTDLHLVSLIRQSSAPLPILPPPDLPPGLEATDPRSDACPNGRPPSLGGIRAVIFDVYGTLFISAAGDIAASGDSFAAGDMGSGAGESGGLVGEYGSLEELRGYFRGEVLKRHEALRGRTPYPELRVEEIWAGFLAGRGKQQGGPAGGSARELALRYELAVNPVYPMPGAAETLGVLRGRGIRLGLISNAQFFTPLLFDAFFGGPPEDLGFDQSLLTYSFELGEAKPSPNLFAPAARRLPALGLKPENALYVGNDMLNDIFAASRAGFKTALFAGDRRSLRLRDGDSRVAGVRPDRVIRGLKEVIPLLDAGS